MDLFSSEPKDTCKIIFLDRSFQTTATWHTLFDKVFPVEVLCKVDRTFAKSQYARNFVSFTESENRKIIRYNRFYTTSRVLEYLAFRNARLLERSSSRSSISFQIGERREPEIEYFFQLFPYSPTSKSNKNKSEV